MKRTILTIIFCLTGIFSNADDTDSYLARYRSLTARVGDCGVGVETLLDKWEASDSSNLNMMLARFNFYYAKSESDTVIRTTAKKHLGQKAVMSLKDSLGTIYYYFQDKNYDDVLFGKALTWIDKALSMHPARLDLFEAKASALARYEKGSPDLALEYILSVISASARQKTVWEYPSGKADDGDFESTIQKLCFYFFNCGTPGCMEAFHDISALMLKNHPANVDFIDNMGSYFLVAKKQPKTALKYYNKALKIKADDPVATKNKKLIQNGSLKLHSTSRPSEK